MGGGGPVNILTLPPPESGCRIISINISIKAVTGNRRITPSGTETDDPFSRILFFRNANRGE